MDGPTDGLMDCKIERRAIGQERVEVQADGSLVGSPETRNQISNTFAKRKRARQAHTGHTNTSKSSKCVTQTLIN